MELVPFWKGMQRVLLPLPPHEDTVRGQLSMNQEAGLQQTPNLLVP